MMLFDIVAAQYIDDYRVSVTFENGKKGIIDFSPYVNSGGVFKLLVNKDYFKKFYINEDLGTICWPNGADVAPESLYQLVA
jgi:hypothetical protein